MKYCRTCILPSTRPNLEIGPDGSCNCASACVKDSIAWSERESLFREVIKNARAHSVGYDCIIPVSGGKDSTWQVVKCLEYGLNPLCVTWKTPVRTAIGQKNLDNLISLGVDHIDYQVNPKVEKRFMLESLRRFGSPAIPMHMALFAIPLQIAVKFRIPLVIWGENSAFEYGGPEEQRKGFFLNAEWLKKFGVTHGTVAADWISETLSERDLTPYFAPTEDALRATGTRAVFLGYYFRWDPIESYRVAKQHGFSARPEGPKLGLYDFADIDDDFIISVHHWIKWYKFGFTRLWDNLSLEIRNGRMTRTDAIAFLRNHPEKAPIEDIQKLCRYLEISEREFFETIEKFRNPEIWFQDGGKWKIKDFLISNWSWA